MKVPPKKPHFFKPILPGFKNGLKIPIGFLKYLKRHDQYEHAILRRKGKKWLVKVNDRRLEKGNWKEFVEEHDLQLGDLLIFKYEGDMEFEVSIFDSSHCDKEYVEYLYEDEDEDEDEEEEGTTHDDKSFGQPHFECIVRPYCLSKGFMILPQQFAIANGLTHKKCALIVRDERQRSWNLKLNSSNIRTRVYIGDGWRKFAEENFLKEGDRLMFEIVTNGETPIWKFRVVTHGETPMKKSQDEDEDEDEDKDETTYDKSFGQPHFECIIRQYCLSKGFMFLPQQFAIAYGLTNKKCALILRDERQKSWNIKLNSYGNRTYIGNGWRKFAVEKYLKEGDRIMFEIVTNGETPIWKFRVVTHGETPMKKFQEKSRPNIKLSNKTSSHAEVATIQSHFECTIAQYCISRGYLYIPKQFAYSNGLNNKKCDLIIRDERQRSWNLKFCYWGTEVNIRDGWYKFMVDNCLKKRDRIMFEVVTNGETPIWKFQVVTNGGTSVHKFQDIKKKPSNPLNAQVSTSTSGGDDDHPYFVSTIKPYCISKPILYLPLGFAKSNGLMNRKCEMILKNEAQRCWSVWLGRESHHFGIMNGWTKFREENGLQVGDAYKFELIKNGKIPIAQFHCKFSGKVAKRVEH